MRRWLKTLYDKQYFPAIAPLVDTPQDRQISEQWAAWMKQKWQDHGLKDLKQQRNLMTEVRQTLKQQLGEDHIALQTMNFTREEWIEINLSISDTVAIRNEQQSLIEQPNAIVDRAKMLLDSQDWAEVTAGLAVVTGRRCTELLQTAEFIYESPYTVWFTGALKRRQEERTLRFEIPTLVPAKQVIATLSKLRQTVNTVGLDLETINRKFSSPVAKACDRHFAELVPQRAGRGNLYTHLFRTIYARIATHWFAPPTVADIEYMAAIQGHFLIQNEQDPTLRRSLASTRHYNDYKIGDGQGNINGRQGVRLGNPGVQVLGIFQQAVPEYEPEPFMLEEESPLLPPRKRQPQLPPKHNLSTLWLYRDEGDRWLQLLESLAPKSSQPDQMSVLLARIEQSLSEDFPSLPLQRSYPPIPRLLTPPKTLEQSANIFITTLQPLRNPVAIRSLCQQEIAELEQTHDPQDYLPIYEGAIATAIRSGQLPLIDEQTAERLSYTKQGVSYVQRTHYALRFLTNPEHEVELTTAQAATPTPQPTTLKKDPAQAVPAPVFPPQPQIAVTPQPDQGASSSSTTPTLDDKLEVLTHALAQLAQLIQTEQIPSQRFPVSVPTNGQTQRELIKLESLDTQEITLSEQLAPRLPFPTATPQKRNRGKSGKAEARIIKAIDAMMTYNNAPHRTHTQKWEISLSALKRLTKSYQGVIQRVLDVRKAEIKEHHQLHGLKPRHNIRHGHAGVSIEQVIQLEPD